jgi:hypothetical protein
MNRMTQTFAALINVLFVAAAIGVMGIAVTGTIA